MTLLSLISFTLAVICNAIMDTSVHHYSKSIFVSFNNPTWWDGSISWKNKYVNGDSALGRKKKFGMNIPVQFTDAFHFFKSLMVIFLCVSIVTFTCCGIDEWYKYAAAFSIYGVVWNVVFSLFYNKVFLK